VTVNLAAMGLQKSDVCHAELSNDGGSTWSPVLTVGDGDDSGTFQSGTVSPPGASDNANLRLRIRMTGKGKGDKCWGDEIVVRGVPMGNSLNTAMAQTASLQSAAGNSGKARAIVSGSAGIETGYGSRGFDPGFDHLFGDGQVARAALTYDGLVNGRSHGARVPWSTFAVPAGAAIPAHLFEGRLTLLEPKSASGLGLPAFDFEFVQVGNHLFPLGRAPAADPPVEWRYVLDTGRVWSERGDAGFSRAAIPFKLVQQTEACTQEGMLTFLFDGTGATSHAYYQLDGHCADVSVADRGIMGARYLPAALGNEALGIESVMACAAETWLPLFIGRGGISLMLTSEDTAHYVLRDGEATFLLDAARSAEAMESFCD